MQQRVWRGLIAAVAVGLATELFGVVGCVVIAAAMVVLWRWPKPQVITASVLASVFFVAIVLLQGYRSPPVVAVAPDSVVTTEAATRRSPTAAEKAAAWQDAAIAFEAAHPDLQYGQNMQLVQERINEIDNPTFTSDKLLQAAYSIARLDPKWTKAIPLDFDPHAAEAAQPPAPSVQDTYVRAIIKSATACESRERHASSDCWINATPRRCRAASSQWIARVPNGRRAWLVCIRSCATASVVSRTLGDCHRD